MKSKIEGPSHTTTDDIFGDLGFSLAQALELKIKSDIWMAIRRRIEASQHSQRTLCDLLDEQQPEVSNLINGRIAKMSIEKLLRYADRLNLMATVKIKVRPIENIEKDRLRKGVAA